MNGGAQALINVPQAGDEDIRPAVEAELDRVVSSPLFKDTTRMKRFLKYVVNETLEGRGSRIKGYSLGVEVFDRPEDFDPQADTIVRVQAGQLRRRLDLYYSSEGQGNPVRIVIPKGTYAPKFEIRQKPVDPVTLSKTLDAVLPIETQNRPGIAVLTFDNLTSEPNGSFFAEGLTIELVNALAQFRYLRIVARTATVLKTQQTYNLKDMGREFGVQFVLSGTVRRVRDLVRVSVSLLSTETGVHVYTKIFDRKCTPDNLFEIQDEIASYVAANVGAPYGAVHRYNRREKKGRRSSMEGYDAILKYYEMNLSPTDTKAKDLMKEIKSVTKRTPRFSSAWAVQSLLETYVVTQSLSENGVQQRLKDALKYANRSAAIDPENGLAFMALFAAQFHSGDIQAYRKSAMRALALNPYDYVILAYYALTAAHLGDWDEAFAAQKAAISLVARAPRWFYSVTFLKAVTERHFDFGSEAFKDMNLEHAPVWALFHALSCAGHTGDTGRIEPILAEMEKRDPDYAVHVFKEFLRWNPTAELKDIVIEGCVKAGLRAPGAIVPEN